MEKFFSLRCLMPSSVCVGNSVVTEGSAGLPEVRGHVGVQASLTDGGLTPSGSRPGPLPSPSSSVAPPSEFWRWLHPGLRLGPLVPPGTRSLPVQSLCPEIKRQLYTEGTEMAACHLQ